MYFFSLMLFFFSFWDSSYTYLEYLIWYHAFRCSGFFLSSFHSFFCLSLGHPYWLIFKSTFFFPLIVPSLKISPLKVCMLLPCYCLCFVFIFDISISFIFILTISLLKLPTLLFIFYIRAFNHLFVAVLNFLPAVSNEVSYLNLILISALILASVFFFLSFWYGL